MPRAFSSAKLKLIARRLRQKILTMAFKSGSGHIAGSLSCVEILVALYFGGILKYDPSNFDWDQRDRLIISNGHVAMAVYVILAEAGFFPENKLGDFEKVDSLLRGHVEKQVPGVEHSSGLLGQGLSVSVGLALGLKETGGRVFCLMSDGEQNEGQVWEAAMSAAKYKTDNLVAIVDANRIQIDGTTEEIMPGNNLKARYESFGWRVIEAEGNSFRNLSPALTRAIECKGKPALIVANTIAGKGIDFMEGDFLWHGKKLDKESYLKAFQQLEKA